MRRGHDRIDRTALAAGVLVLSLSLGGCASTAVEAPAQAPPPAPPAESPSAPAEAPAETSPLANTLRWKTASEVDNFGFDVFRGPAEDGPFERVNADTIPGAGTTDEPQQYAWVDDTIEAGVEYWYYVESISIAGVREKFTPVFKAKAKYPSEE